jgi:hypothetical protein
MRVLVVLVLLMGLSESAGAQTRQMQMILPDTKTCSNPAAEAALRF